VKGGSSLKKMGVNPRAIYWPTRAPTWAQLLIAIPIYTFGFTYEWFNWRNESWRMTRFRDKSALFGCDRTDENPSWGPPGPYPYRITVIPRLGGGHGSSDPANAE